MPVQPSGRLEPLPALIQEALPLLHRLAANGYQAFFVGGCVRDAAAGRPLADVDIATSALPADVMELFPDSIPTGLQHGTVTVKTGGKLYEVTTFRTESGYADHRRPQEVEFIADLHGDLLRRDFTVNAMALDPKGTIIDPFHGLEDLRSGVIRAVGTPRSRFTEDALRMIRAIRFASVFGFSISHRTWKALRECAPLLRYIAMERVGAELDKMMKGPSPASAAAWLHASGLLSHTKEPLPPAFTAARPAALGGLALLPDADDRWAALSLALEADSKSAGQLFRRLKFSKARADALMSKLIFHEAVDAEAKEWWSNPEPDDFSMRKMWVSAALACGITAVRSWLDMTERMTRLPERPERLARLRQWTMQIPENGVASLNVDGREIAGKLQERPGPWLGALMRRLLLEVAMDHVANEREPLLDWCRQWSREKENEHHER
ncbi:CCA tRNA nucleotidyltransferase [Paenibacillus beijingensis]|uniref:tRNA CCA-pyrophosphorylase n=1 Tax=Paenibacillus beijingensis TaxID=1126833 RepID=A0A0D5NQ91_9BACL|nr:CCA tRNA nucleotidyltransferase [Paenibacillus beijingensis]AJY77137.1 hypothetical protein VN24_24565 [Paenibacillus beijingensis]